MSAIKRFFSSHKTSSHSKTNPPSNHENQISQTKSTVPDKAHGPPEHDEIKENTSPIAELPSKYFSFHQRSHCLYTSSFLFRVNTTSPELITPDNNEEKKTM